MIRLATVFSGIGAIEHTLERMGLEHKIVFACDNGDVDILSKKIDDNIKAIDEEIKNLKDVVSKIENEQEFTKQLYQCESKFIKVSTIIDQIMVQKLKNKLSTILEKSLNKNTKKSKIKEFEDMQKILEFIKYNDVNSKFEQIKITLKIINDFTKDNSFKLLDETKIKSNDNLDWVAVLEEI